MSDNTRSVIEHFHRHGHVALDEVLAALMHANSTPLSSGPVGLMNLHYALARKAENPCIGSGTFASSEWPSRSSSSS